MEVHECLKGNCIIRNPTPEWVMTHNSCVPAQLSVSLARYSPPPVIIYYLYNHREGPRGSCKFQLLSEPCTFHLVFESSEPHLCLGEKGFISKRNS